LAPNRLPKVIKRPPISGKIREESERESQRQSAPNGSRIRLIRRLVDGRQGTLPQIVHAESHGEQI
jgi:hypothetical protein